MRNIKFLNICCCDVKNKYSFKASLSNRFDIFFICWWYKRQWLYNCTYKILKLSFLIEYINISITVFFVIFLYLERKKYLKTESPRHTSIRFYLGFFSLMYNSTYMSSFWDAEIPSEWQCHYQFLISRPRHPMKTERASAHFTYLILISLVLLCYYLDRI